MVSGIAAGAPGQGGNGRAYARSLITTQIACLRPAARGAKFPGTVRL